MSTHNQGGLFLGGFFIAAGLAVGGYFIGQTMFNAKVAINTAEVKGLAERRVKADTANWTVEFRVSGGSRDDVPRLYSEAEEQKKKIVDLLEESGFEQKEIDQGVLKYNHHVFRNQAQMIVDEMHQLVGTISVETQKVDQVNAVRQKINRLIAQGIQIENLEPIYKFTKINEIKPSMLKEATKNARLAASEFAENAGVEVGGIREARQGSFMVRDVGEEYGDTAKLEKNVRVVSTISFYLTD